MEMREFGGSGIQAPVVVRKALDVGINFLDMAGEHGSGLEERRAFGEAATFATADDLNTSQAITAANGLTSFATMEANCSTLVRDAEKAIIQ